MMFALELFCILTNLEGCLVWFRCRWMIIGR